MEAILAKMLGGICSVAAAELVLHLIFVALKETWGLEFNPILGLLYFSVGLIAMVFYCVEVEKNI